MQKQFIYLTLVLLIPWAQPSHAQQPRWELFFPNLAGAIAVDPSDSEIIYIASDVSGNNGMWKSADGGMTWIQISNGINIDPRTVWHIAKLEQSNTLYAATARGIYKSTDGGDNWFSVNDSVMSTLSFRGGLVVAEQDTNVVFAGAGATLDPNRPGGIYKSYNGGQSWLLYNSGLPDSAIDYRVTNLFLGKAVITLLDEVRRPGEYRKTWDGANTKGQKMPSAIYLAKLQVGGEQVTIKLLLSK